METQTDSLAVALFSEILAADQLARNRVSTALPKGMELSHFIVLNHLARTGTERTPAQIARAFHLSKSAMTNTLAKLEMQGFVHIRPDWDDARRKMVQISPAGQSAREKALGEITPVITNVVEKLGAGTVRAALPILRELRLALGEG